MCTGTRHTGRLALAIILLLFIDHRFAVLECHRFGGDDGAAFTECVAHRRQPVSRPGLHRRRCQGAAGASKSVCTAGSASTERCTSAFALAPSHADELNNL